MRERIAFVVQTARPGFWSTAVWFYLLPLGRTDLFGHWPFWLGLVYCTLPLGHLLYGWNDYLDAETDKHNPRKGTYLFGARGDDAQRARLPAEIALIQLPFAVVFTWLLGPKFLLWLLAAVVVNAVYNWPRWGFKHWPVLDVLNQAGYLLVFVLASWLNDVPQLPAAAFVFGALFAMHSHLFGQVMDLEPDRQAGRRTTAVAIGVRPAKLLIVALLATEAVIVHRYFGEPLVTAFLAVSACAFLVDLALLFGERPYAAWQMRASLLGWNVVTIASMHWIWARGVFVG